MTTTLASMPNGSVGTIATLGGERGFRRRLLELGFLPGTAVRLIGAAPMGDPLDVEVRGCRFSLRRAEAKLVVVETGAIAAAAA
ncbi:MAG: ferrous iron transport protein A [Myxococcales bacterium]|nr:ferrous iron transport protein A [Myxococcales bacterium]